MEPSRARPRAPGPARQQRQGQGQGGLRRDRTERPHARHRGARRGEFLSICSMGTWLSSLASVPGAAPHSRSLRRSLTPALPQRHLTYGPLVPPQKAWVPLWLAVHLKKKRKCRVVAPQWMSVRESQALVLVDQDCEWEVYDLGRIDDFERDCHSKRTLSPPALPRTTPTPSVPD